MFTYFLSVQITRQYSPLKLFYSLILMPYILNVLDDVFPYQFLLVRVTVLLPDLWA